MSNKEKSPTRTRFFSGKNVIITLIIISFFGYAVVSYANPFGFHKPGQEMRKPYGYPKSPSYGAPHYGAPHYGAQENLSRKALFMRCLFNLDLTDKQKEDLIEIKTQIHKETIQIQADIRILEIEEQEAIRNENFKKAKNLIDKIADKKVSIAKERIDQKEKLYKILTDEQKEELKEMIKHPMYPLGKFPEIEDQYRRTRSNMRR